MDLNFSLNDMYINRSRALKSCSKLRAAIGLGAAFGKFLFYIKIQAYLLYPLEKQH